MNCMSRSLVLVLVFLSLSSPLSAEPPFSGTIFIDPDIINEQDPTTLQALSNAGIGERLMYDRRLSGWITNNAFLFDASYNDGLTIEVQVNSEFETAVNARSEAAKYAEVIGRLPRALRRDVETVWIHKGTEPFGGGNNNLLIHVGQAEVYIVDGILEETLVHEAAHTSLDADHAESGGWLAAQRADSEFISTYAQDNPVREDIAESFLPFLALAYRSDRMSLDLAEKINATIPNRIDYFRAQGFDLSLLNTGGDGATDSQEIVDGTDSISGSMCATCFTWDVDGDGEALALTDGLLVIRHLFGFTGNALIRGAVATKASRVEPDAIRDYLSDGEDYLDVDGDSQAEPLTDGLLLIRQLFGFTGDALIAEAVSEDAERSSADVIISYVEALIPESASGNGDGSDDDAGNGTGGGDGGAGADTGTDGGSGDGASDGESSGISDDGGSETDDDGAAGSDGGGLSDAGSSAGGSGTDSGSGGATDQGAGTDSGGGGSSDNSLGTDGSGSDGGSETGGSDDGGETGQLIEVTLVYDRVPYCEPTFVSAGCGNGLDYQQTTETAMRYVLVDVLTESGDIFLHQGLLSGEDGKVSFSVEDGARFIVRAYSESTVSSPGEWSIRVVNNQGSTSTAAYPLYAIESDILIANGDSNAVRLSAKSGWGGTGYTSARASAPFAILDSMISATQYALSGRSTLIFTPIDVYWSTENTLGAVGTSYYVDDYIMILGDVDVDTDEYDESVVIHEWGHYFQSILSRDDSLGGGHGSGDLLDMRVAFSEGWANAYSGLASNRAAYRDTSDANQSGGFSLQLEQELTVAQGAVKGWYSEDSIQYFVFDLFDGESMDDDEVDLPVSAMIASLVDFMPEKAAATSVFSFVEGVLAASDQDALEIMNLLQGQQVAVGQSSVDVYGANESNSGQDYSARTGVSDVTLPIYLELEVDAEPVTTCQDVYFGGSNKLGVYRFVRFSIGVAGNYNIKATTFEFPQGATSDPDFYLYGTSFLRAAESGNVGSESSTLALEVGDYWLGITDWNNNESNTQSPVPGHYCQKLEVVSQ